MLLHFLSTLDACIAKYLPGGDSLQLSARSSHVQSYLYRSEQYYPAMYILRSQATTPIQELNSIFLYISTRITLWIDSTSANKYASSA